MVYTVDMSGELPHSITSSSPHIYCRQVHLLLSEAIEVLISFYFASTFAKRLYEAESLWLCWAGRGCFRSVQRLWREDILRSDKQPFMSCGILSHRPMLIRRGFPWWYHKDFSHYKILPKIIFTCVVIKDVCGLAAYWGIFMHKEDTDSIHITTPKTKTNINTNS